MFKSLSIVKEESRESVGFGTLPTADEIKEITVPENGVVRLGYTAAIKSSVANEGRVSFFVNGTQIKADKGGTEPGQQEVQTKSTTFHHISSCPKGLETSAVNAWLGDVTSGQALSTGDSLSQGGFCTIYGLAPATYSFSVRYKALSGSITSKERRLWVELPE